MANEEVGMSGRGRAGTAIRGVRRSHPDTRYILAGLIAFVCVACIPSVASADVDMTGKIAPGAALKSGLRSPGLGAEPLVNSEHDGVYHCSDAYSTIANVAGGLAIGNCPDNEEFDVEDYGNGGTESGYFYGGYFANVGACAWVKISEALKESSGNLGHCSGGIGYEYGTFYSKINSESVHDGFYVNNSVACEEYANVYPWGADTAAGPIRNVAPYTESHETAGYPALKWRYVTNNGKYVMVRDTTVGGGEGNWVFVERSCLPASLPSASEALPPKPTATTAGASGVATPNATLNATVNPNGLDTKYFFEYGTTTSYGSYTTTEDAGAGTSGVAVNAAITGLAAGTTYYFRIVASSATGETFGGAVAFTTQPPPTVATSPASSVQEEEAVLDGTVNPNGLDAKYHFQYGETTAYGSSTSEGDAGAGLTSVPESGTATGLQPAKTYHYRLVATSSAGTTYGGDQTFQTASRPAPVLQTNGEKDVFYHGSNNTIWDWGYHAPTWTDYDPGGSPVGSPSSVVGKGFIDTFYRGTNNTIWDLEWNGSEFTDYDLGGSPAGDPSAVALSGGGDDAFYRGTNGAIWGLIWNGTGWANTELGGSATGTPAAVQGSVSTDVYYRGTDGTIYDWEYGTKWTDLHLGGSPAGSPAAMVTSTGGEDAYYQGTNDAIWGEIWNGTGWTNTEL